MDVVIINYNSGNVHSVENALNRLGVAPLLSDRPEEIIKADKVIFPGVGEASTAMDFLQSRNLDQVIKGLKQPVFGVCLGLQLMCKHSAENDTKCLGIFDVEVKRFEPKLKVPQMGWNTLTDMNSTLFNELPEEPYVYYVHSYYAALSDFTVAQTDYINPFSAALQKDNFYALQAHPEKSGKVGEQILKNFLEV